MILARALRSFSLALILMLSSTLASAAPLQERTEDTAPSPHAKAQIARLHEIKTLIDAGRADEAEKRLSDARNEAGAHPAAAARIDADEMQVAALAARQRFADARLLSERVVQARRGGPADEQLLLCWALLQHAIVLDGVGDTAGGDRLLVESIGAARHAFPAADPRRAQMLEAFADLMARGYNRPMAGVGLYEAAIQVRQSLPQGSRADLAETLRKLALILPAQGRDLDADGHLQRAISLLMAEAAAAPTPAARSETNGDIATLLGMRVGLAARAQHFDAARALLATARGLAKGTATAPFMDLYAADIDRREAEFLGDPAAAIAAARHAIALAEALREGGSPGLVASLALNEGRLEIDANDLDGGEATITRALKVFAQSPAPEGAKIAEGWLLLARIARARGHEQHAARWITGALAMLKARRSEVPVLFATNRAPLPHEPHMFGTAMAGSLSFGAALVLVPGAPPIPGAGLSTLGGPTELERLLVTDIRTVDRAAIAADAQARMAAAKLYPKTALLFVHGFGTTFEFALARAAQISRDIAYDGPTFLFTWPSQGWPDPRAYSTDEMTAGASVAALADTIRMIADTTGAEKIHIVAHSMGNQVLLKALGELRSQATDAPVGETDPGRRIGEVVFAAPDVDQGEFKERTARLAGLGMTLYASAYDKALWLSLVRNRSLRAGSIVSGLLASGRPVLSDGVDSIDVSDAGRDYFGFNHDVYVSSPHIANDLRRLLQFGERPPARRSAGVLFEEGRGSERFWRFRTVSSR